MTDSTGSEWERRVYEAEILIEAGHEDRKSGKLTHQQQVRHSYWVYEVFMRGCPEEVIRAVQEYETFIINETA